MIYVWADDKQITYDDVPTFLISKGKNVRADLGDLTDLAESIKKVGVIEPIVLNHVIVDDNEDAFILVAGERRLEAAKLAGLNEVPCRIFREMTDVQLYEIMLAENFNREDMSPIDEAKAFRMMLDNYDYTQQELGGIVGRSQSYIANHLRLLELPEAIQKLLVDKVISVAHAMQILSCKDAVIYDSLVEYFSKNIPSTIRPVSQFKDQFLGMAYDCYKKSSGNDPDYVIPYWVGENTYEAKCSSCPKRILSYCYDHDCYSVLRDEAEKSRRRSSSSSPDPYDRQLWQSINFSKKKYISDLEESVVEDIDSVLLDSGLSSSELLDRFLSLFVPVDEDKPVEKDEEGFEDYADDDLASIENLLDWDCRDYIVSRFHQDMSVDDFVRIFCGAMIREVFLYNLDYQSTGTDIVDEYSKILRDHGLSSKVFDKKRKQLIKSDIELFDKRLKDVEDNVDDISKDISDLPVIKEAA